VIQALRQPVVQALTRLIRFRSAHPAYGGAFTLYDAPDGELRMAWHTDEARAELWTRPADAAYRLTITTDGDTQTVTDLAVLAW
jgi:hypothetical protein